MHSQSTSSASLVSAAVPTGLRLPTTPASTTRQGSFADARRGSAACRGRLLRALGAAQLLAALAAGATSALLVPRCALAAGSPRVAARRRSTRRRPGIQAVSYLGGSSSSLPRSLAGTGNEPPHRRTRLRNSPTVVAFLRTTRRGSGARWGRHSTRHGLQGAARSASSSGSTKASRVKLAGSVTLLRTGQDPLNRTGNASEQPGGYEAAIT